MKKTPTFAAALLAMAVLPLAAQTTQLTPPQDRISDEAIAVDQQAYETLQGRIKGLNDRGRPVADYFLSKAQCWLDVSFHEYTRNDRSAFPQEAMTESEKLIVGMERGDRELPLDTALVNGAARLRQDLWDRAALLKQHPGWRCAQQAVACAEVELVHAGNEFNQQQWRHAKPYVQIAEDLVGRADEQAQACIKVEPKPEPKIVEKIIEREVIVEKLRDEESNIGTNVVFRFDKHTEGDVYKFSIAQLKTALSKARAADRTLLKVRLEGHADRLNSTGQNTYNDKLSEKRVNTVKGMLTRLGVDAGLIEVSWRGDHEQVEGCKESFKSQAELQECLLPNRRVEVIFETKKK